MDPIELKMQRLQTTAFIAHKPTWLVMNRPIQVRSKTGGKGTVRMATLEEQIVRIIETAAYPNSYLTLTDGTHREADFMLLMEWDADVQRDDTWTAEDGRNWVVQDVVHDNEYERRALVLEQGKGRGN